MTAQRLDVPPAIDADLRAWVERHLGDLAAPPGAGVTPSTMGRSSSLRGGQQAADAALAAFDVRGYARLRSNVWPESARGSSMLSPYIRHGLLTLREVWEHVSGGPDEDVSKFRDELLWQEYARHLYARVGSGSRRSLRFRVGEFGRDEFSEHSLAPEEANPWTSGVASSARCLATAWSELTGQGWLPNQTRMWLASHWSVREGRGWREGEDLMFRHLLDGSRAANRLGWQWTVGALTGKAYGFSRWQVEKRAPGLCASCPLNQACPIQEWPDVQEREPRPITDPRLRRDDDGAVTAGPDDVVSAGEPDVIWLTAESLGDRDPAVSAHPDLPVVFVFDEALLRRLRLSVNRFTFLAQTLADLAERREVQLWRGDPVEVLQAHRLATTFAPVPGWRERAARLDVASLHPWPWLRRPRSGPVTSYTAWIRSRR